MSKSICLLCHNTECDNSQQFKEDRVQCSAFKDGESIDWEQRRYELAKELYFNQMTDVSSFDGNIDESMMRSVKTSIYVANYFVKYYQNYLRNMNKN